MKLKLGQWHHRLHLRQHCIETRCGGGDDGVLIAIVLVVRMRRQVKQAMVVCVVIAKTEIALRIQIRIGVHQAWFGNIKINRQWRYPSATSS